MNEIEGRECMEMEKRKCRRGRSGGREEVEGGRRWRKGGGEERRWSGGGS